MNYISPVKLFYEDLQDKQGEITAKDLSLIRRKLLAEAELSENKTVVRDGVEYSKEDIISTFDEMDKDMRMVFYPAVIGWFLLGLWIATLKIRLGLVTYRKENAFQFDLEKKINNG